eukprot:evm.model.NODE_9340_length_10371_cov_41.227173.2
MRPQHTQIDRNEEKQEEDDEDMEVVGHVDKEEDDEFEDLVDLGRRDDEGKRRPSAVDDPNLLLAARAGVRI